MVSVIIPNYNKFDLLENCIKRLLQGSLVADEIIVVDNGSSDFRIDVLFDPRVRVIYLPENIGFSKAVNIGIHEAKGDYIAILNNDTEVDSDWLKNISRTFEEHSNVLFVTSKIKSLKNKDLLDDVGDVILPSGKVYKIGNGEMDTGQYGKQRFIFGASGCASVYRREFFEKVGYFDEDFFAYLEDVDLSFRANLLGLKCLYVPDAIVYHYGSATTGSQYNKFTVFYLGQNTLNVITKNYPFRVILKFLPSVLLYIMSLQVYFLIKGYGKSFFRGILRGIEMMGIMKNKRREIMSSCVLAEDEVLKYFEENKKLYKLSKQHRKSFISG